MHLVLLAVCLYFLWLTVVEDLMENLSWILSQMQQISLTQSTMRWMQSIDQLWITSQNIDVPSGSAVISLTVYVYLALFWWLLNAFVSHMSQPLTGNIISWVQSLQLGLWAAADNMWHCLAFATRAHVGCCKPHFFWQDAQWPWLVQNWFRSAQWCLHTSNHSYWIVGSSTSEELTTGADFYSSRHWEMVSVE